MYNSFARRNIILVLDESAAKSLVSLYKKEINLVVSIVIEAFNQATFNARQNVLFAIPVPPPPQDYTQNEYLVICTVTDIRFHVHLIM